MKQYKKFIAFMLGAIVTMSNVDVIRAEKIGNDISGHWGQQSIERWVKAGIIQGDGTNFYPNNDITRAEMAVIISNLLGLKEKAQNNFVDLEDKWYTEAILKCNAAGIMLGDGNKVRPNDPITRQEAAVLIGKTLAIKEGQGDVEQFKDSKEVAGWAQGFVTALSELGILKGYDNKIHPSDNISRASVMAMLDRAIGEYITEPGTYEVDTKGIVIIAAPDVILENAKTNSVIILPGLEHGEVVIKNSTVKEAIIASGVVNALKVIESVAQGIIIENKVEQVIFEGNTLASNLIVTEKAQGLSLNVTDKVLLEEVVLKADDVIVNSKGSISNILVDGNNVILDATNTKVIVNEETSNIKVNGVTVGAGVIIADSKDSDKGTVSNNSHNSHNGHNSNNSDDSDDSSNTYYVVTFDTGVENININKQSIKKNNKIVQPEVEMIREGYIFEGWYNGSEPWDFTKDLVNGDMTLTAKWKKIVEPVYQVSDLSLLDSNAICFRIETEDGKLIKGANLWTGGAESSAEPKGEYIIKVNWVDQDGNPVSLEAEACDIEGLDEYLSVRNTSGFKDGEKKISNITVEKVKESKWNTENGKWEPIIESTKVLAVDDVLKETKVESIELSEKEIRIKVGETKKVTANVKPIMATDKTITIQSNDEKIAKVSDEGEIIGIAPGKTTITYTAENGVSAECKVVVSNYQVSDLSLADKTAICFLIEKEDGKLITKDDLWKSTSGTGEYIITVNWIGKDGKPKNLDAGVEVVGSEEGYLGVTNYFGFKDDEKRISNITVKKVTGSKGETIISTEVLAVDAILQERELESFELSEKEIRIKVGETKKVTTENFKPVLTTDRTINVKSENEAIAIVSNKTTSKGVITGIAPGETTITYTAVNGLSQTCKVVVESKYQLSDLSYADGKAICFLIEKEDGTPFTKKDLWKHTGEQSKKPEGEYIIKVNWVGKNGEPASLPAVECYIEGAKEYLSVTNNEGFKDDKKKISNITVEKVKESNWVKGEDGKFTWQSRPESTEVLAVDAVLKERELESFELSEEKITIKVGEIKQVQTTNLKPILATDRTITKVSKDKNIATVDSVGNIKGIGVGETTITWTALNGKSQTCKVVVESAYQVSDLSLVDGNKAICFRIKTADGKLIKGDNLWREMPISAPKPKGKYIIKVNWVDKDGKSATSEAEVCTIAGREEYLSVPINDKGFQNDEKKISNITVEEVRSLKDMDKGKWQSMTVSTEVLAKDAKLENAALKEAKVESIELIEEEIRIKVGETKSVIENVKSIMAEDQTITIVSENEDIVTVSDDQIIGMAPGETTITYQTADGLSVICKVVVEAKENAVESLEQIENNDLELTLPTESVNGAEEQLEDSEESTSEFNEKEEDEEAIIGMNPVIVRNLHIF